MPPTPLTHYSHAPKIAKTTALCKVQKFYELGSIFRKFGINFQLSFSVKTEKRVKKRK